jgi:hypothetical protein
MCLPVIQLELTVTPPQELLGLPHVEEGESKYAKPSFWPKTENGLLILEDLPHALPAIQAMGMSLILEGRVGPHVLPEGWKIIGTGNRAQDGAGAYTMPTATASRMVHVTLDPDVNAWRQWAISAGIHEDIVGLLGLRPDLLHKLTRKTPTWPSPRTWEMASKLHAMGFDVAPAVGQGAAAELKSYVDIKSTLPDLQPILNGNGKTISWPDELSLRWAMIMGLAFHTDGPNAVRHAFVYLNKKAGPEWKNIFLQDVVTRFQSEEKMAKLAQLVATLPEMSEFIDELLEVVA